MRCSRFFWIRRRNSKKDRVGRDPLTRLQAFEWEGSSEVYPLHASYRAFAWKYEAECSKSMAASKTIGNQRRCPGCTKFFVICRSCDRGHRYCSSNCKLYGRRKSWKRSTKIYQQTPTGKINHSERQKRYRKNRQLKNSETQHSSEIVKNSLQTIPIKKVAPGIGSVRKPGFVPASNCIHCHRNIRFFINSS